MFFYGIKYGTARRLFPANPVSGVGLVMDAVIPPPLCIQKLLSTETIVGVEDCLFLNVYRPRSATPASNLPVMVWIHGGYFQNGGASLFDGTAIATAENAIVVTMNYRLGLLGFFYLPVTPGSGNLAMLDQRLALKWVQNNILNFGGNPNKVVLVGESSGGMSVNWHLVSPGSAGLFSSAVVQSGTGGTPAIYWGKNDALLYYEWVAYSFFKCHFTQAYVVSCLSSIPASSFFIPNAIALSSNAPTWATPLFPVIIAAPVIDGIELLGSPEQLIAAGNFNKVPLIIGSNYNEGSVFITLLSKIMGPQFVPPSASQLSEIWNFWTSTNATQMNSYYFSRYQNTFDIVDYQLRDLIFLCSMVRMANSWVSNGAAAYVYQFTLSPWSFGSSNLLNFPPFKNIPLFTNTTVYLSQLGSFHSFEVPLLFKQFVDKPISAAAIAASIYNLYMTTNPPRAPHDHFHNVSDLMSCFWLNMARCGSPNCQSCGEASNWLPYTFTSGSTVNALQFDGTSNQMGPVNVDVCPLWTKYELAWRSFATTSALTAPVSGASESLTPSKLLFMPIFFVLISSLFS